MSYRYQGIGGGAPLEPKVIGWLWGFGWGSCLTLIVVGAVMWLR